MFGEANDALTVLAAEPLGESTRLLRVGKVTFDTIDRVGRCFGLESSILEGELVCLCVCTECSVDRVSAPLECALEWDADLFLLSDWVVHEISGVEAGWEACKLVACDFADDRDRLLTRLVVGVFELVLLELVLASFEVSFVRLVPSMWDVRCLSCDAFEVGWGWSRDSDDRRDLDMDESGC